MDPLEALFGEGLNKILDSYSDEELNQLEKEKGPMGVFKTLMEDALFSEPIKKVKEELKKNSRRVLSDEVEDYFLQSRAESIVKGMGMSMQMMPDDRLGVNMDYAMAYFKFNENIDLPFSKHPKLERFQAEISKPENEIVGEFLMRSETPFFQLLIYYAKVDSFDTLRPLLNKYKENQDEIKNASRGYGKYGDIEAEHGLGADIIEFFDAVPAQNLEKILKKTNVQNVDDYSKLFFNAPYMTAFLRATSFDLIEYLINVSNVNSVDDFVNLTKNEKFRYNLANVDSEGDFPKNLVTTLNYFEIKTIESIQDFMNFENISSIMKKANDFNYKVLINISDSATPTELERLCSNTTIAQNIGEVDYSPLVDLLANLNVDPDERSKYLYEVITHSYNKKIEEYSGQISSHIAKRENIPDNFESFVVSLLKDEDYIEQNLSSVSHLMSEDFIKTNSDMVSLNKLKDFMGGFITPALSKAYLSAKHETEKEKVLKYYQKMMKQVLGSEKISIEDPVMVSETIFLAYRPTGYSIEQIQGMLGWGWDSLEDLTHHLEEINFKKEGYKMHFNFVQKEQKEEYDSQTLRKIDSPITINSQKKELSDILFQALSGKAKDQDALPLLFSKILHKMNDDRVKSYQENYYSDKGFSKEYTDQRLESLGEIMGIIPKEDEFYQALEELTKDRNLLNVVKNSADAYQWKKNKRNFSPEERACKNKIDEMIKQLESNINNDISSLLGSNELKTLDENILASLFNSSNEEKYALLQNVKNEKFLGYNENLKSPLDVFYQVLLTYAKQNNSIVKREMRKVKSVMSDETAAVTAVVSKNIGSYFAKAGAEICTSHNIGMWQEKRHSHLNLVYKNQIIGNIMLYFEPERDYMVVRGFNPRKDTMMKFDRYSMAKQIVGVLEEIAIANNYKEIFIPEQTGWHALSNRDGMAKEINNISKKTISKVQKIYPTQRTVIDDAQFYVTKKGGTAIDKLNLLSLIE